MPVYDLDSVERFVAGTVGPPGARAFYLQARAAHALVTVALEKQQVQTLAERLDAVIDQVAPEEAPAPGELGALPADNDPLETPFEEDFRVTAMSLQWDENTRRFTIECFENEPEEIAGLTEEDAEAIVASPVTSDGNVLRVQLTPLQARAFAVRCAQVVLAGRPPCPICSGPLDPTGHICPRANGYRR